MTGVTRDRDHSDGLTVAGGLPTLAGYEQKTQSNGNSDRSDCARATENPLALFDRVEIDVWRPAVVGNLAVCPRCRRAVHSSNGYRCRRCPPKPILTRNCSDCGEATTSASGYVCAACHFRGWWGRWA